MEVRFEDSMRYDQLTITAEDAEEAEKLERWNNCIISAKYDYDYSVDSPFGELTLIKEI